EARLGSVTSNDGKLYAIRRELFRPIAPGATDDLFTCLSVVEQGRRFVFEPRAHALAQPGPRTRAPAPHRRAQPARNPREARAPEPAALRLLLFAAPGEQGL